MGPSIDPATWTSLATRNDGFGYLYVIQFDNDVVKVGKTIDPTGRMATHISQAAAYRSKPASVWFSDAHQGFAANETTALSCIVAKRLGKQVRREYFHGANFDEVVDIVERVCLGERPTAQLALVEVGETLTTMAAALPRIGKAAHSGLTRGQWFQTMGALIGIAAQIVDLDRRIADLEVETGLRTATERDARSVESQEMLTRLQDMLANKVSARSTLAA